MVQCKTNDCTKQAIYGYEIQVPLACKKHRILEPENLKMFNVVLKKCFCKKKIPIFGLEQGKATHCFECKTTEMFNIISKKCFCGISKPYFGLEQGKATHCYKCKTTEMFNVISKKCLVRKKCFCKKKSPNFGLEQGKATHCFECKTTEMFNVISKKCFCGISNPNFGVEKGKATHCYKCKTKEMFDVKNKKCFCGISRPIFGVEKGKATHCYKCKTKEMFDVKNKKCLCGISPKFGLVKGIATHCSSCKTTEMFNVVHEKCKTEGCNTCASNQKYKGYCMRCFFYTFPEETISRNYKTKETAMVEFVKSKFLDYEWIWDKKIAGGSSLRRPDLFLRLPDKNIILECQESHHKDDEIICVNRREMEISKDVKHTPTVIIYFNPDKYINENNIKIPSCWSITKETGMLKIAFQNKWNERLKKLEDIINYWIKTPLNQTLRTIELFHDKK